MKKIYFILVTVVFTLLMWVGVQAGAYAPYIAQSIAYDIHSANISVRYPKGDNNDTVFCNGRLCVTLKSGAELMGAELEDKGGVYCLKYKGTVQRFYMTKNSNRPVVFKYGNEVYISLYELITPLGFEMLADIEQNSARICKSHSGNSAVKLNIGGQKAYIRFEDITADGLKPGGGRYTVGMLEKLKYSAEYMYAQSQHYYISWIPVYACPESNYWNDVSREQSLYNAYFLYVMDYMADHNGHIGLHGYTHQYGSYESAVGNEWGENTPFNFNEQQRRMRAAKVCCDRLGYKAEFFEFPHYAATDSQLKMAEYYFDVIYQAYPDSRFKNNITYTTRSGRTVYYLPTPADYVRFKRDYSIFERLEDSFKNGYAISLFYHPTLDFDNIMITENDGERAWHYNNEACLPSLVSYVSARGCSFAKLR